jgi:2-keto-4-pentenoate hydratase
VTLPPDPRIARGMRAQLAARRARLAGGDAALGWKVGFGAPAALERYALSGPLVGFLLRSALVQSGDTVWLGGWTKPVAEPEIAVYLGADIPAGASAADAAAAVAALGPAIELADLDAPPDEVESILTRNIYQRRVVLGPRDPGHAGAQLKGLHGRVHRTRGAAEEVTDLEANTGRIVDTLRHAAELLAASGAALRAGDVVIAGSVVAPLFVGVDDTDFGFDLEPIGSAAVRFAHA